MTITIHTNGHIADSRYAVAQTETHTRLRNRDSGAEIPLPRARYALSTPEGLAAFSRDYIVALAQTYGLPKHAINTIKTIGATDWRELRDALDGLREIADFASWHCSGEITTPAPELKALIPLDHTTADHIADSPLRGAYSALGISGGVIREAVVFRTYEDGGARLVVNGYYHCSGALRGAPATLDDLDRLLACCKAVGIRFSAEPPTVEAALIAIAKTAYPHGGRSYTVIHHGQKT